MLDSYPVEISIAKQWYKAPTFMDYKLVAGRSIERRSEILKAVGQLSE